jgi:hypothetical protein
MGAVLPPLSLAPLSQDHRFVMILILISQICGRGEINI